MRALRCLIGFSLFLFLAIPLSAQGWRIRVAPLAVTAGDTADHVDLSLNGSVNGANQYVVASLYNPSGKLATMQAITWTIGDTAIVSASSKTGMVLLRARRSGATVITAAAQGVKATIVACVFDVSIDSVSIKGPDLASLTRDPMHPDIVPTMPSLGPNSTLQYAAINTRNNQPYTPACVHWQSRSPTIVSVTRRGLARNISRTATATVTIEARVGRP